MPLRFRTRERVGDVLWSTMAKKAKGAARRRINYYALLIIFYGTIAKPPYRFLSLPYYMVALRR